MDRVKDKILYRVVVTAITPEIGERFYQWMLNEHGDDLLHIDGCVECRVYQKSATEFENHYVFESATALNQYFENHAERLRAKAKEKFAEGDLQFKRDEARLVAQGY